MCWLSVYGPILNLFFPLQPRKRPSTTHKKTKVTNMCCLSYLTRLQPLNTQRSYYGGALLALIKKGKAKQ